MKSDKSGYEERRVVMLLVKERMGSGDRRNRKRRVIGVNLETKDEEGVVVVAMLWFGFLICYIFFGGCWGWGWVLEFAEGKDGSESWVESDDE